jgi:uncharacterized protein
MRRAAAPIAWLLGIAGFFAATQIPLARFDADFSRLDDADLPSFHLDKEVNRLLGRSQTPMVILAESEADAREAASLVREQMKQLGDGATIGLVTTRADLLPNDQLDKKPVLERIAKNLRRFRRAELDPTPRRSSSGCSTWPRPSPSRPPSCPTRSARSSSRSQARGRRTSSCSTRR